MARCLLTKVKVKQLYSALNIIVNQVLFLLTSHHAASGLSGRGNSGRCLMVFQSYVTMKFDCCFNFGLYEVLSIMILKFW